MFELGFRPGTGTVSIASEFSSPTHKTTVMFNMQAPHPESSSTRLLRYFQGMNWPRNLLPADIFLLPATRCAVPADEFCFTRALKRNRCTMLFWHFPAFCALTQIDVRTHLRGCFLQRITLSLTHSLEKRWYLGWLVEQSFSIRKRSLENVSGCKSRHSVKFFSDDLAFCVNRCKVGCWSHSAC